MEVLLNSDKLKVCGSLSGFVNIRVQLINLIVFDIDDVNLSRRSIELELKVDIVEEKDGYVVSVALRNFGFCIALIILYFDIKIGESKSPTDKSDTTVVNGEK